MRKIFGLLLILLMFAACGQSEDYGEQIAELQSIIAELEAELAEANAEPEPEPFSHGLTAQQVKESLLENDGIILATTGGEGIVFFEETIQVNSGHVMAYVDILVDHHPDFMHHIHNFVLLSYQVRDGAIHWHMVYDRLSGPGVWPTDTMPAWPAAADTATVRFVSHWDSMDDTYHYFYEEINSENWRNEAVRLMRHHTGIRVKQLWYEGDRLVVDLFPVEGEIFNWGSGGAWARTLNLIRSFASFPGVNEIEVLVDGAENVWADHFAFGIYSDFDADGFWGSQTYPDWSWPD